MQPNIALNFAEYMVRILLCKYCKFGEKNYYNSRDIEFFLGVPFLARPVGSSLRKVNGHVVVVVVVVLKFCAISGIGA